MRPIDLTCFCSYQELWPNCQSDLQSVEVNFGEKDAQYTRQRGNIEFEERVLDAGVRGFAVTHQFEFGLPNALSLAKGIHRFTL